MRCVVCKHGETAPGLVTVSVDRDPTMNRRVNQYCLFSALVLIHGATSCTDRKPAAPPVGSQSESSGAGAKAGQRSGFLPQPGEVFSDKNNPRTASDAGFDGGQDSSVTSDSGYLDSGELAVDGGLAARGESGRVVGMLAYHNAVRARIYEGGVMPVQPLGWSVELAFIAQANAENMAASGCIPAKSANGYGENLAYYGGTKSSAKQVVEGWAGESGCYSYGMYMVTDSCSALCGQCANYTQIVWRDTSEVGCGVAVCNGSPYREIWCCNYNPPGNLLGLYPY